MRMQNSDSCGGDMQNGGSGGEARGQSLLIMGPKLDSGHIPHFYNLLSIMQDIYDRYVIPPPPPATP